MPIGIDSTTYFSTSQSKKESVSHDQAVEFDPPIGSVYRTSLKLRWILDSFPQACVLHELVPPVSGLVEIYFVHTCLYFILSRRILRNDETTAHRVEL